MLWELRCSKDGFSVEAAAEKGRELPDWYLNSPELKSGDTFYLKAFRDLGTCRSIGMDLGPIPWFHMVHYAELNELEYDITLAFVEIIRVMDDAYLNWIGEQREKNK